MKGIVSVSQGNKRAFFLQIGIIVFLFLLIALSFFLGYSIDKSVDYAPSLQINKNQLYEQSFVDFLSMNKLSISDVTGTGSMKPCISRTSIIIYRNDFTEDNLKIGDIVYDTFHKVLHRIVKIGQDEKGKYYIVQGDNNEIYDGKIRFSDIKGVVVGIIYS